MKTKMINKTLMILVMIMASSVYSYALDENLLQNGDFENGFSPWSWYPSNNGMQWIDDAGHSGKCIKMKTADNPGSSTWIYQTVNLSPGKRYWLNFWFKASDGLNGNVGLIDDDWKDKKGKIVRRIIASAGEVVPLGQTWIKVGGLFVLPEKDDFGESLANHRLRLYIYATTRCHKYGGTVGVCEPDYTIHGYVYYDEVALVQLDTIYGPAIGVVNDAATKSFDLGSILENVSGGTLTNIDNDLVPFVTHPQVEGETNFREYKASLIPSGKTTAEQKMLLLTLPAFNVDSKGFPLTPILLEVRFKDTLSSAKAGLYSKIDYLSDGFPATSSAQNKKYFPLLGLWEKSDNQWRYAQYMFQKSAFQLIRAIDGKFIFAVYLSTDPQASVAIDYVTLRAVSHEECLRWQLRQRELKGSYELPLPLDEPVVPLSYERPLTVFVRDIMRPIYQHTKPRADEINQSIIGFTSLGEVEPLSLGLYSDSGIDKLMVTVSDLKQQDVDLIPAGNISIHQVVYWDSRLHPANNMLFCAHLPDHLANFTELSISPKTSQRLWFKVRVPENVKGGLYQGKVDLKRDGQVLKTVPVQLEILPLRLEHSQQLNFIYHAPDAKAYCAKQDDVFQSYRETGVDSWFPLGGIHPLRCYKQGGCDINGAHYEKDDIYALTDTAVRENLAKYIAKGLVKQGSTLVVNVTNFSGFPYGLAYNNTPLDLKAKDMYYRFKALDDSLYPSEELKALKPRAQQYEKYFKQYMRLVNKIASDYGVSFIYDVVDEPTNQYWPRILADRMFTLLKDNGAITTNTYEILADSELEVDSQSYLIPGQKIPPLSSLVDYKIWSDGGTVQGSQGYKRHERANFQEPYKYFGVYTPLMQLRNPIYNRFVHGFLGARQNITMISAYAFGDNVGDPFNDFDGGAPDYILAYPTWEGTLYPSMALEGMREGIKDAKYIATLKKAIKEHPGTLAEEAQAYLGQVIGRINPYLYDDYLKDMFRNYHLEDSANVYGAYPAMIKNISESSDPQDYEAFSKVRRHIFDYIKRLSALGEPFVYGDISGDSRVTNLDAALAGYYSVGLIQLSGEEVSRGDLSLDGKISAWDAALIARKEQASLEKFVF